MLSVYTNMVQESLKFDGGCDSGTNILPAYTEG